MPKVPKDVLNDTESEYEEELDENVASSSRKSVTRGAVVKRTRTDDAPTGAAKGKRKMGASVKDTEGEGEIGDLTPLTKGDIPAIVAAVLQSIKPAEVHNDDDSAAATLPGQSIVDVV